MIKREKFKLRKSKAFKNLCAIALVSVTLGTQQYYTNVLAEETTSTEVTTNKVDKDNPTYQEIAGEKTERTIIRTQEDLNNIIKRKGSNLSYGGLTFENKEKLVFPAGVYKFDNPTYWLFPESSKGDIDFSNAVFLTEKDGNFQWEWHGDHSTNGRNQEIKGITVYSTPYGELNSDYTHKIPKFNALHNLLVHTQNVTFKDWTVKAGLYFGTHTFDIMGSDNIIIDNFKSQGLGIKAYTKEELEGANNNPRAQHDFYAEAVQIDYAGYGASGMKDWSKTGLWKNDKEDLLPSTNITIKNSTFEGYNGKTGESIINGTNDTINLPYGATIGSHYVQKQPYKNIIITNNVFKNTINFGKNPTDPAIDPIHMHLNGKTTTQDDLKTWNISNNQILDYQGADTGNATIKRTDQYITWTKSDLKPSTYLKDNSEVVNSNTIDNAITVEDGRVENQEYRLISWKKDGAYKLQTATNKVKDGVALPANLEYLRETANDYNTPIITTGGFWSFDRLDSNSPMKELSNGRTGYLVSDGNNNFIAKEYNQNESIIDMMKFEGSKGWNVGAFGAIVKDGKLVEDFGKNSSWKNDPNQKSGRTLFIELNNGTQSILSINGHSSQNTGVDHNQIVNILKNIGIENIKLAFVLDGGGSTRSYVKTDDNKDSLFGSLVDNRQLGEFLYLTKDSNAKPNVILEQDKDKVTNNTSKSVNYNMFKEARDNGLEKIPGTNYDTGIKYETVTEKETIPYSTIYKANPNKTHDSREIITKGENGTKTINKKYKYIDDVKQDSPEIITNITEAKNEVIEIGTKPESSTTNIPITTETRYNDKLPEGENKIIQEGVEGYQTVSTRYDLNTTTGETFAVVTNTYSPMVPKIVEIGTGKNIVAPLNIEYKADDSLEVGTQIVEKEGQQEIKDVTGKILTNGESKVIRIGTKSKVTTEIIPFKENIEEDNTLEAGKTYIKQQGINGTKITTIKYSVDTKTGEIIEDKPVVKENEATNQILVKGTKSESVEEKNNSNKNTEIENNTENKKIDEKSNKKNDNTKELNSNTKTVLENNDSKSKKDEIETNSNPIKGIASQKAKLNNKVLPKTNSNKIVIIISAFLSFILLVLGIKNFKNK